MGRMAWPTYHYSPSVGPKAWETAKNMRRHQPTARSQYEHFPICAAWQGLGLCKVKMAASSAFQAHLGH
jgi:hypothetical protein